MTDEHPVRALMRDIEAAPKLTRDHLARACSIAGVALPMTLSPGDSPRKRKVLTPRQAAREPALFADVFAFASLVLPEAEFAGGDGAPPYQIDMRHKDRFASLDDRPEPDWFKFRGTHKTNREAAIMLVLLEASGFWHPDDTASSTDRGLPALP